MRHTGNHSLRPISSPCGRLDLLSEEPAALFVYGSLRFPEVLRMLLDRVPANRPAAVTGWRVAALRDHVYPALVPADTNATGQLLTDLSRAEWHVLDAFEDNLYDLACLTLDDGHHGWAYVSDANAVVLPADWNAAEFMNRELRAYVERCRRWRHWYEQQQPGEQVS
jgi:gamma-glutamylcyclotransferase (GGCT)/AIG2-like uncharacterized protein YtfP